MALLAMQEELLRPELQMLLLRLCRVEVSRDLDEEDLEHVMVDIMVLEVGDEVWNAALEFVCIPGKCGI